MRFVVLLGVLAIHGLLVAQHFYRVPFISGQEHLLLGISAVLVLLIYLLRPKHGHTMTQLKKILGH